jgi:AcrR family transcriptional regulator
MTRPRKQSAPEDPRPRRSDATRARILAAARDRFTTDGYERTTIRRVAADAEIDPSMVMRYFGSKEGLFAAAATVELKIPDFGATPKSQIGTALVNHFLDRWEGGGDDSLQILLRTAASNQDAAARFRAVFRDEIVAMVRRVRGKAGSEVVAALIATQMLGLAYCRYILRLPPLLAMSREAIARSIGANVQRYLGLSSSSLEN